MRAFIGAIIRGTLVMGICLTASAFVIVWLYSGRAPSSVDEFRSMVIDVVQMREMKKKMVTRTYDDANKIHDDFLPPVSPTNTAATQANEKNLEKALAKIAAMETKYGDEINLLKVKLDNQQLQLDRIENENRTLSLQIAELTKNSKIKTK
jgi:hypothetical protein